MFDVSYKCATTGEKFDLSCEKVFSGIPDTFRKNAWDYKLGFRNLSYSQRASQEIEFSVALLDLSVADRLRRSCDADVSNCTPGTLSCGVWHQRAYVISTVVSKSVIGAASVKLVVILIDGTWRRDELFQFRPGESGELVGVGHGYPYGYPYGYPCPTPTSSPDSPGLN